MFNILIVEDDGFIRDVYKTSLECLSNNIDVFCASNGEDGLAVLQSTQIDFVILDLKMDNGDGIYVLRNLQLSKVAPYVILCSSIESDMLDSVTELARMYNVNILGTVKKPELPIALIKSAIRKSNIENTNEPATKFKPTSLVDIEDYIKHSFIDSITIFYQPQISLKTMKIVSFESLARLTHPKYGLLLPYQFLPYLDDSELNILTWQVIDKTFRQLQVLNRSGYDIKCSINIPPSIMEDIQFPEQLKIILDNYDLKSSNIVLEMLESNNVDNKALLDVCTRLRLKGFNLSIDDFGENQSSFERFKRFPFNEIKIDRKFINNLTQDKKKIAIVNALIKLGKDLKIPVIAEGVETENVLNKLIELGCDYIQGYLVSPPINDLEFVDLLKNENRDSL